MCPVRALPSVEDMTASISFFVLIGLGLLSAAAVVLFFWALFSIALQPAITGERKAIWILLVIVLPLLGPLVWLIAGRPDASRRPAPVGR